jgi:nucleoside-diphosphate-sugar epimerase
VTNKQDVYQAVEGADAIVHAAALHGIHLAKHSRDDFWKLNVEGTYNVYEAAKQFGVNKVLLCSTMGVYGESVKVPEDSFAVVTEDLPLLPKDFYGLSKTLCEEMAKFYNRSHGIRTIAYRLGMFVPETLMRYGFRLLKGGVDDRDVAQAFLLGLENQTIAFDAFNIMSEVPFSREQLPQLKKEPLTLIESNFPGISDLVRQRGENIEELLNMWRHVYWPVNNAKRLLGYKPTYNFPEFYAALKEGRIESHYSYAGLPWWGI